MRPGNAQADSAEAATPGGSDTTGATVLVADDDAAVSTFLEDLLSRFGYSVHLVDNGYAAVEHVRQCPPDIAILDVCMPGLSGVEVCRHIKTATETRLTPVILMTGLSSPDARLNGLAAGADEFVFKPVDGYELIARVRTLVHLKRYTDDLESAASVMMTLAAMIDARDGYSEGHCHRMANYAIAVGRSLSLDERDLQTLRRGGFLHDIGMLAVPDAVLRKTTALEPGEYELIQSHTILGESLVKDLCSLHAIAPIVRHHHERRDGSGYPDRLRGEEIPLLAQIIGIVDVFEAITSPRAYRSAAPAAHAIELLREHVQRGWRRDDLVECFVATVHSRGGLSVAV